MTILPDSGSAAALAVALGAAVLAAVLATVLATTACSGPAGNARTATVGASGDGVLKVGLLLDNSGAQGFLNDSEQAAANWPSTRSTSAAG